MAMRRLAKAVKNNDWVEMAMWAEELKENIGFNCVELYMIENNDVSNEFMVLSSKFNRALNKLILCSKEQDTDNANLEFNNLVKSCDACHEAFQQRRRNTLQIQGKRQSNYKLELFTLRFELTSGLRNCRFREH